LKKFLDKYRSALKWIGFALVVKTLFFAWYAFELNRSHWAEKGKVVHGVFVEINDWGEYMEPVVNLVETGKYFATTIPSKGENGILWAHRMPGFVPLYAPLYFLLGYKATCVAIAMMQLVTDAIACFLVGWIAWRLFKRRLAFYIAFFLYLLSSFVSVYTHYGSSEALCTFFIILSVFFFIKFIESGKRRSVLACGLFIAWAFFLRPAAGIIFVLFPLIYLWQLYSKGEFTFSKAFLNLLTYGSFFLVFESIWIIRNYNVLHRFIPVDISQENFGQPQYRALIQFTSRMGCDQFNKDSQNGLRWFSPDLKEDASIQNANPFNEKNFTGKFNLDSLKVLRQEYWLSSDTSLSKQERKIYGVRVLNKISGYTSSLKQEKPLRFYVINRLIMLRRFVFVKQTYALPFFKTSLYERAVRGANWALNTFTMSFGILGILLAFWNKNRVSAYLAWIPALYICVHALVLGFIEHRYLVPVFPLITIFAALPLMTFLGKLNFFKKYDVEG